MASASTDYLYVQYFRYSAGIMQDICSSYSHSFCRVYAVLSLIHWHFTGHMQWLFDVDGNRYLDMVAGIATVIAGHCHPKINEVSDCDKTLCLKPKSFPKLSRTKALPKLSQTKALPKTA